MVRLHATPRRGGPTCGVECGCTSLAHTAPGTSLPSHVSTFYFFPALCVATEAIWMLTPMSAPTRRPPHSGGRTMPATLKATLSELFRCLLWPTMLSLTPMTASVIAMTSGVSGEAAHTTWTTVPDMHRGRARRLAGLMASITFGALSRQPLRVVRTDCTWCQWQHRVAPHMELIG